jgi:hypothetical protein
VLSAAHGVAVLSAACVALLMLFSGKSDRAAE